jgi:predicted enzyme related to lactoylglutathione lyase
MKKPEGSGPSAWLPYIGVEDVDATFAKVEALGGTVWVKPTDIPNVGRFAVVSDPTGAMFALYH